MCNNDRGENQALANNAIIDYIEDFPGWPPTLEGLSESAARHLAARQRHAIQNGAQAHFEQALFKFYQYGFAEGHCAGRADAARELIPEN